MINSFPLNIDTCDIKHREVDLNLQEIKYVKQNYEASAAALQWEGKNLETLGLVLDSQNHEEWIEKTPDRMTLRVNYKEDNFGIETKEITTTYHLNLIKEGYNTLEYKDRLSEGGSSVSKYSYLKHLSQSNRLHFSHEKAEVKLINMVTTSSEIFRAERSWSKRFQI